MSLEQVDTESTSPARDSGLAHRSERLSSLKCHRKPHKTVET